MSATAENQGFWARQEPAVKAALIALIGTLVVAAVGGVWKVYTYETNSKTVTAAEREEACESTHHMRKATVITEEESVPPSEIPFPTQSPSGTLYQYCSWPPEQGADSDGYVQIRANFVAGPGKDEASGDNYIEEIYSPCNTVIVKYEHGFMGAESFQTFAAQPRTYMSALSGRPWNAEGAQGLAFYLEGNEVAIVQNIGYSLTDVRCG